MGHITASQAPVVVSASLRKISGPFSTIAFTIITERTTMKTELKARTNWHL